MAHSLIHDNEQIFFSELKIGFTTFPIKIVTVHREIRVGSVHDLLQSDPTKRAELSRIPHTVTIDDDGGAGTGKSSPQRNMPGRMDCHYSKYYDGFYILFHKYPPKDSRRY